MNSLGGGGEGSEDDTGEVDWRHTSL
jgi:hypothetical protein